MPPILQDFHDLIFLFGKLFQIPVPVVHTINTHMLRRDLCEAISTFHKIMYLSESHQNNPIPQYVMVHVRSIPTYCRLLDVQNHKHCSRGRAVGRFPLQLPLHHQ